ncbi:MAG: hypothetical protein U0237_02525 [Thermoleophilia bacterium]
MAKKTPPSAPPRRGLPQSRVAIVGAGVLLGAVWGLVMWGLTTLIGQESGVRGLLYLVVTMAMMGGGVAAIFGAGSARRRGERVTPKLRRRG